MVGVGVAPTGVAVGLTPGVGVGVATVPGLVLTNTTSFVPLTKPMEPANVPELPLVVKPGATTGAVVLPVPAVGEVIELITTPEGTVSVTVTFEPRLKNPPVPVVPDPVNGPSANEQNPFCANSLVAAGPATTVIVLEVAGSKPSAVPVVTVKVNTSPTATPAPATLQIFNRPGLNIKLTNSTSFTPGRAIKLMLLLLLLIEVVPVLEPPVLVVAPVGSFKNLILET